MNELKEFLDEKIDELKKEGEGFLKRTVKMHDFKSQSGRFGIYAERGGETFMIRIKIPFGVFLKKHSDFIKYVVEKYNIKNIHLTTRQAIQLHRLPLDTVVSIFKECLENDIISYGCGGNFPRNVALSPTENDEISIYAEYTTEYFVKRMREYHLPRKVKVAFSSNDSLAPNVTVTDIGFLAVKKEDKLFFKMFLAGGLGRNSSVGLEYPELIDPKHILYYVEALVNLFREYGNYENKNKARIRYILQEKGEKEFLQIYKKCLDKAFENEKLCIEDCEKRKQKYVPEGKNGEITPNNNVIKQTQKGRYTVLIKPFLGDMLVKDFLSICDFLEKTESNDIVAISLSPEESIYVQNLDAKEALELLKICEKFNETIRLNQSVSCIGVPICQIGLTESQTLLKNIIGHFKNNSLDKDLLPAIHISGCQNSCGKHSISKLGFVGKKKMIDGKVVDIFGLCTDGDFTVDNRRISGEMGDIVGVDVPLFLEEVYHNLENISFDEFKKTEKFSEILDKYKI